MDDYNWILIIAIPILISLISSINRAYSNSKKYNELKPKLDNLDIEIKKHQENVQKEREGIEKIIRQKSMAFPWLAQAFADYYTLNDEKKAVYLTRKSHPAFSSAQIVREVKEEKRGLVKLNKFISYKINYYEKLFPWLTELIAEDENEEIPVTIYNDEKNEDEDNVQNFLTQEEYRKLPSIERNQRALDRYLENRNKSKWQIGRDYEMYVGHIFEKKGYKIEYKGIIDGFDDLGRDIIASKNNEVCIIQCKYWAQYKDIHEKHIFQLFGTTMDYWIKNFKNNNQPKKFEEFAKFLNEEKLRPIFFTSTTLSETAKQIADTLSIEVVENEPIGNFPRIKCNISGRNSEKIYHLPFDQQYDRTIIEPHKGEFFAYTVKDAENVGFRRAFKHKYKD